MSMSVCLPLCVCVSGQVEWDGGKGEKEVERRQLFFCFNIYKTVCSFLVPISQESPMIEILVIDNAELTAIV